MYQTIVTSDAGSSSNITIPTSLVTLEDGRPSNSSHGATGGPRCLGTLDSTPRRATVRRLAPRTPRRPPRLRSPPYICFYLIIVFFSFHCSSLFPPPGRI